MAYSITLDCTGCTACKKICPSGAVTGEKKDIHTIRDEICIDCGACGRVCAFGAVETPFGRIALRVRKKEWERPFFDLDTCTACNICLDACPVRALETELQKVKSPHAQPWLAREADCLACGFCARECPVDAVTLEKRA